MFGRKRRPQADFSAELEAHLALEVDRLIAEGLSEEAAQFSARRNLGNLTSAGERFYEGSRWLWLEHLGQDSRHMLRRLMQAPAFTLTAILTLALGIGATTSIFTLVHAILLKSLPVAHPERLYRLGKRSHCCVWGGYNQDEEFSIVSYELYQHLRDHTKGFEELAAFQAGGTAYLGVRRVHSLQAAESYLSEFVSGNYFEMFGLTAYTGRLLTMADDQRGAEPAAVMSYRVWEQKYGRDPSVVGEVFNLDGKPFTVVGIAPPGFFGDTLRNAPPDFFMPLAMEPFLRGENSIIDLPNRHWLDLIGRMGPAADARAIEAQMRVELQQWLKSHLADMSPNDRLHVPKQTLYLSPGGGGITSMREEYEHWLTILMMVSGFILLIVCANLANLMLVRGMERRQQTSLSMALGARPGRLLGQAFLESIALALAGGVAGVAVAFAGTRLILHFAFQSVTASPISASPSLAVLLFAFGVSLITGTAFGLAPAWMTTRVDPVEALRGANRSTRQTGSLPRRVLVVLQAALSMALLCASGLLTKTLNRLEQQDFGFEQDQRMVVQIDPVLAGYKPDQLDLLYRRIRTGLASLPGIASVAVCWYSPLGGDSSNDLIFVQGRPAPMPGEYNVASIERVTPGFFETIGNPILKGRPITEQDTPTSRHVAVVNEAFARTFFKDSDAIGKHFGKAEPGTAGDYEIVGIAKDARILTFNLTKPIGPFFFLPESQSTSYNKADAVGENWSHYLDDIVIKMQAGAPAIAESQVRRVMAGIDPNLPVIRMRSLRDQVAGTFSQSRLIARLTSLFGFLALVLASVGLYGVTAYNASSRTNEIGIRMALGANRSNVLALILRGASALLAVGLILGIPLTLAAGRFLGSQLYGVNQADPVVMGTAVVVLGLSALIAALIPAFRASSISPMEALRAE